MIGTKRWRLRGLVAMGFAGFAIFAVTAAGAPGSAGDLDTSWGGTGYVTTPFPGVFSFADGVAVGKVGGRGQGGGRALGHGQALERGT